MDMDLLMIVLGMAGACLFAIAYLPQVRHILKFKSSANIRLSSWVIWALGTAMFLLYAAYTGDMVFITLSGLTLIFLVIIIGLCLKYRLEMAVGIYRHYKGGSYEVFGTALHSETLEEMVLYRHLKTDNSPENRHWVRPRKMFFEEVDVDGVKVLRFKFLRENAANESSSREHGENSSVQVE